MNRFKALLSLCALVVLLTGCKNVKIVPSIESLESHMWGTWEGFVTTPWVEPYQAEVIFFQDGTYSDLSITGTVPTFYYGIEAESQLKTWELTEVSTEGRASGNLEILFQTDEVVTGEIRELEFIDGFDNLTFEFWNRGENGPVEFALVRTQ